MTSFLKNFHLARYRKLIAYVSGALAEAVTLGLLHGTALQLATVAIAAATGAGIFQVPNDTTK